MGSRPRRGDHLQLWLEWVDKRMQVERWKLDKVLAKMTPGYLSFLAKLEL